MPREYTFELTIVAVVRVRAENESVAREVVTSSALRSPSADEIRLANEADLAIGKEAALVAADFSVEGDSIKLIGVEEQR
jgi:hypothetical protein